MGAQRERHTPSVQVQGAHVTQDMGNPRIIERQL